MVFIIARKKKNRRDLGFPIGTSFKSVNLHRVEGLVSFLKGVSDLDIIKKKQFFFSEQESCLRKANTTNEFHIKLPSGEKHP